MNAETKNRYQAPISSIFRKFGGHPAVFQTFAEIKHPQSGLCRLDRDEVEGKVTWYVRRGIDSQGCAMRGGSPFKSKQAAIKAWEKLLKLLADDENVSVTARAAGW